MALVKQSSYLSKYPSDAGGRISSLKSPTNSLYPSASGYSQPIIFQPQTVPTFTQTDFTANGAAGTTPQGAAAPVGIDPGQYMDLINGDPLYQLSVNQRNTEHNSNLAALRGGEQTGLIRFGEIPDNLGSQFGLDLTGAVDDQTRSLAQQNTTAGLSTVAQLQRQREDQNRSIVNVLASRGMLRTGDYGFQENRLQDAYTKSQYDARNALMDYLAGLYSGYANNENTSYQSLVNAMNGAISRALQNPAARGGGGGGGGGGVGGGGQAAAPTPAAPTPTSNPYDGIGSSIIYPPTQFSPGEEAARPATPAPQWNPAWWGALNNITQQPDWGSFYGGLYG